MSQAAFAGLLITADPKQQIELLQKYPAGAGLALAQELQELCAAAWTSDPDQAQKIARALTVLASSADDDEIRPYAEWARAIADLIGGQVEAALAHLEQSEEQFINLGQPHRAANTQISKLYVLALLGRYEEAIRCGQGALKIFLADDDQLAAGKIEHNIGGVYSRRDLYPEARLYLESARKRFLRLDHLPQLAKVENSLAIVLAAQNDFRGAERLFQHALTRSKAANLLVTEAEIEGSIGNLELFVGRYDRALEHLQRSLSGYVALSMPHQIAVTELEMAGVYLELNLLPEALALYEKTEKSFAALQMQAELARCLLDQAKTNLWLGHHGKSLALLDRAGDLYALEGNPIAVATVKLIKAQLFFVEKDHPSAMKFALEVESELIAGGSARLALLARLLQAELKLESGDNAGARSLFEQVELEARSQSQPQVRYTCLASLGKLARAAGQYTIAERYFSEAVRLVEATRGLLPSEDYRSAYFANKLTPYHGLVLLALEKHEDQLAFNYLELARMRTLNDAIRSESRSELTHGAADPAIRRRLVELRADLNWYYRRLNRTGVSAADRSDIQALRDGARSREKELLELLRRTGSERGTKGAGSAEFDLAKLQVELGTERAFIEYALVENELLAFVLTDRGLQVVRRLSCPEELERAATQFMFQCRAMRLGPELMGRRAIQLLDRVVRHSRDLYDRLLRPLEELIGSRHLVIAPSGPLHYLPFQALHDGAEFLAVQREVSYAPGARILLHCLERPSSRARTATLVGVADAQASHVRGEIEAIKGLVDSAVCLLDDAATPAAIREGVGRTDLLHLACHGNFRPDNPLFSALHLVAGSLTVRDICSFDLRNKLVTLSACETGLNAVLPGEELIGLARGFFSAGATSLVTSLWNVNDRSTARLMTTFYARYCQGGTAASALREAQIKALAEEPHPYYWAPFILVGRW